MISRRSSGTPITVVAILEERTSYKDYQGLPKKNGDPIAGQIAGQIAANRGKSRQIAAKFGKFRFKKNGDHFFKKSRPIASQRAFQKTMAITLEVKFDPYLACTILVHAGQFLFSI